MSDARDTRDIHEGWWVGRMNSFFEWVCLALVLIPLVIAYRTMPKESEFARGADEGFYMKYAQEFAQKGVRSIPESIQTYLESPGVQDFPHPGRFGFRILTGLWLKAFPDTYRSLAHMSYLAMVLFLVLSYYFARRYLGSEVAVLYTLLLACSPLLMGASRRVLQDSVLHLFWALPFWLFFEYLMTRRRWAFVVFCVTLVTAMTIKEVSALLLVFFVVSWIVFKVLYTKDLPWGDLGWLVFAPPAAALLLSLICLGGWHNFSSLVDFALGIHAGSGPPTDYSRFAMGPWFKHLMDFLMISPWVTVLAVGYAFWLLAARKMGPLHAYGLLFFLVVYGALSCLKYTKIVRFAMSLEIVTYLFAVLALLQLFRSRGRRGVYLAAVSLFYICYTQLDIFRKLFIERHTYDIISVWLLVAHKILPYFHMEH